MSRKEQLSLSIALSNPGMTAVHKVGLTGLWMTLKAFDMDYQHDDKVVSLRKNDGFAWTLRPDGVTIRWSCDDGTSAFRRFFDAAFRLHQGFFWFPALGNPMDSLGHALILQEALCGTVFQHAPTARDITGKGTIPLRENEAPFSYYQLGWHCFLGRDHMARKKAVEFFPDCNNPIKSTMFPGGDQRHQKYSKTRLEEAPANALALRFVPIGGLFMKIQQERKKNAVRPVYAMVLPKIRDLIQYAKLRQHFAGADAKKFIVAGIADAAYRVVAEAQLQQLRGVLPCRVFSFGGVPWNSQQKSRVDVFTVPKDANSDILGVYRACEQFFRPRTRETQDGRSYWTSPQTPELVARNLAHGREWWQGFAGFLAADDVRRDRVLGIVRQGNALSLYSGERSNEEGGLTAMTEERIAQNSAERVFISACHEAWRNKIRKERERTQGGRGVRFDYPRMFEKQRVAFARCKNLREIRAEVRELLSRGAAVGKLLAFQDNWERILPLLSEKRWREAKDLALLALASYKSKSRGASADSGEAVSTDNAVT